MQLMKHAARHIVIICGIMLGMAVMPWTPVAAQAPATDIADQKDKSGYGKFVSFKDGSYSKTRKACRSSS